MVIIWDLIPDFNDIRPAIFVCFEFLSFGCWSLTDLLAMLGSSSRNIVIEPGYCEEKKHEFLQGDSAISKVAAQDFSSNGAYQGNRSHVHGRHCSPQETACQHVCPPVRHGLGPQDAPQGDSSTTAGHQGAPPSKKVGHQGQAAGAC